MACTTAALTAPAFATPFMSRNVANIRGMKLTTSGSFWVSVFWFMDLVDWVLSTNDTAPSANALQPERNQHSARLGVTPVSDH